MVPPTTDRKVYGGTYPALIWKDVMQAAHRSIPVIGFATPPPSSTTTTTQPPAQAVPTPELVGLTLENARTLLEESGTGIDILAVVEIEVSGTEPGLILAQSPTIGTSLLPGGSMLVEVTVEPVLVEQVRVPDVTGTYLIEASPLLVAEGLGYETTVVSDPDNPNRPPGVVWAQEPQPGSLADPGVVVALWATP